MSDRTPRTTIITASLFALLYSAAVMSELPPALPGEEITGSMLRASIPVDSIEAATPATVSSSATWLDESMKSWDAAALEEQIAADETPVPIGKGAVFIPTFTKPSLEPEVEILDSTGTVAGNGKTGQRYALLPGRYYVMIGSGAHSQRIVRTVNIIEGTTTPIIPNWSGLSIEVVNTDGIPYRGSYELARMDNFQPYGRFYGSDPNLGEEPRNMILPPGLYKIFSPGESYNTLKNFVTVQLMPGRQNRFLLTLDTARAKALTISGGVIQSNLNQVIDRNWKYGIDLGGSIAFTATADAADKTDKEKNGFQATATLLFNTWLRYQKQQFDWTTSLRIEEWPTINWADASEFSLSKVVNKKDEVRLPSLLIWRIFPWVGPYARFETRTTVFPVYSTLNRSDKIDHFYIYDPTDGSSRIDSTTSILKQNSVSPLIIETGIGANFDIVSIRYIESKFRAGFGYKLNYVQSGFNTSDQIPVSVRQRDSLLMLNSSQLSHTDELLTQNAGPEAALNLVVRLGDFAIAHSELKVFIPLVPQMRILAPDMEWRPSISWIITRAITLDYQYTYVINHDLKTEAMQHAVILRFSFSSR